VSLTWFRDPLRLTVLYCLSIVALGMPLVWTFDPEGTRGIFGGLVMGSVSMLVPAGICFALPRRWGMRLFAGEALLLWIVGIADFTPPRIIGVFVLWSLLELPMYALELLGLLEAPGTPLPRPHAPPLLLAWLLLLGVAFATAYAYEQDISGRYTTTLWAVALLLLPFPPVIALRNAARRLGRVGAHPVGTMAAG